MDWFIAVLKPVGNALLIALPILLSAAIGYFFGLAKSFREYKQRAYGELLPPIVAMAYAPNKVDEAAFSEALMKLWLYGSKRVARKMEDAVSIIHHPEKGSSTKALQEAIAVMRSDIQLWPWQRLNPKDMNHLYTRIAKG